MPQAIASEGLAQGPYAAARVGFEPATLRSQGTERTTAPPRPIYICEMYMCIYVLLYIGSYVDR